VSPIECPHSLLLLQSRAKWSIPNAIRRERPVVALIQGPVAGVGCATAWPPSVTRVLAEGLAGGQAVRAGRLPPRHCLAAPLVPAPGLRRRGAAKQWHTSARHHQLANV
jgi:hypothetical protein